MTGTERPTYTVPEGAGLLGVSERLAWKLIAAGRLPVLRLGRRTLITRAAIEELLAEGGVRTRASGERRAASEAGREHERSGPRLLREGGV